MKEQLVSLEVAKMLKEKGFNQNPYETANCYGFKYTDGEEVVLRNSLFNPESNLCVAPTQSIAQKFLRDSHSIDIHCYCDYERELWTFGYRKKGYKYNQYPLEYASYEEALEKGLEESLKLF